MDGCRFKVRIGVLVLMVMNDEQEIDNGGHRVQSEKLRNSKNATNKYLISNSSNLIVFTI
jgi:hypothetical protein